MNYVFLADGKIRFDEKKIVDAINGYDTENVRDTLISIVNNEHSLTQQTRQELEDYWDEHPENDDVTGIGRVFSLASVNYLEQMEAIGYLGPLVERDDLVFDTLFDAALSKKSGAANVKYKAIDVLARRKGSRREAFMIWAQDGTVDSLVRTTSIEILALYDLAKDSEVFDLVCAMPTDTSIIDAEKYPSKETKRSQEWHRKELMTVMGYLLDHRDNDALSLELSKIDTTPLTEALCVTFDKYPYSPSTFARYTETIKGLTDHELRRIKLTFENYNRKKPHHSNGEWVDGALEYISSRNI